MKSPSKAFLSFTAILGILACFYFTSNHSNVDVKIEEASPRKETLALFTTLGIEYLDETLILSEMARKFDVRTSKRYQENPTVHEELTNRYRDEVERNVLAPMSIQWISSEIGYGVFAEQDIKEGSFIGVYSGVLEDDSLLENFDYAWAYPAKTSEFEFYFSIDAALKGNELRFVNDGIEPNCTAKYLIGKHSCWNICYIALKDIKKGDQLLISYGESYWNNRDCKYLDYANGM